MSLNGWWITVTLPNISRGVSWTQRECVRVVVLLCQAYDATRHLYIYCNYFQQFITKDITIKIRVIKQEQLLTSSDTNSTELLIVISSLLTLRSPITIFFNITEGIIQKLKHERTNTHNIYSKAKFGGGANHIIVHKGLKSHLRYDIFYTRKMHSFTVSDSWN